MRILILALFSSLSFTLLAQDKKLSHDNFDKWKRISSKEISPNGEFILYEVKPGLGDGSLHISTKTGKEITSIPRAENAQFTWDSKLVIFHIKPQYDSVIALRREKTKEDELPKDSLGIYDLSTNKLEKIARVKSYKIPKEASSLLTYMLEEALPAEVKKDTTETDSVKKEKPKKIKKVSKDNGYHLVARNLTNGRQDTIFYVTNYALAKASENFVYHTSGKDSTVLEGIYYYTFSNSEHRPMTRSKGKFKQLALSEDGLQVAFLSDLDTTKALIRDFELRYWNAGKDSAVVIAKKSTEGIPQNWLVSENGKVHFSESGSRLFFGTTPEPLVQDTTLLPEEIIQVEVWNYQRGRLHTQENIEVDDDKKKSYLSYYDAMDEKIIQVATEEIPDVRLADHVDAPYALGTSNLPYQKYISWEGFPSRNDYYSIDMATGKAQLAIKDLRGNGGISAEGNYLHWFNAEDTTWYSFENATQKTYSLTKTIAVSMADEENDQPNYPYPYGVAGWTEGDKNLLAYDRFDVWKLDPKNNGAPVNLTNGRATQTEYRVQDLNPDEAGLSTDLMLLHTFKEGNKNQGYATMKDFDAPKQLLDDAARFYSLRKAKNATTVTFQKGNHVDYYDLYATDMSLKKVMKVSDVNPQQSEYAWGSVELVNWTSLDGIPLSGKLYKPANFDPSKKYPMIVNFYETHSDDIHRHWGVFPSRSTVNAAFYANQGYLVFNPDVTYKVGYPGESAYNCVVSGTTALIEKGFVDKSKIGLQGHSWGGYQIAYLITKTDLFACAEAGAIVANMISAYGGIRWWTGLSRMFQYEHTQSRIGGTLWEYPNRYIENSPIFYADKVNTPLLMMHNDADGHVPWYQGIEYFVSLRRLGKPVWMLNYNGEPHWPTKWQNIRDFNIRMNQFFDHYLKDAPMPEWMGEGIPATEKGINKGLEMTDQKHD